MQTVRRAAPEKGLAAPGGARTQDHRPRPAAVPEEKFQSPTRGYLSRAGERTRGGELGPLRRYHQRIQYYYAVLQINSLISECVIPCSPDCSRLALQQYLDILSCILVPLQTLCLMK